MWVFAGSSSLWVFARSSSPACTCSSARGVSAFGVDAVLLAFLVLMPILFAYADIASPDAPSFGVAVRYAVMVRAVSVQATDSLNECGLFFGVGVGHLRPCTLVFSMLLPILPECYWICDTSLAPMQLTVAISLAYGVGLLQI